MCCKLNFSKKNYSYKEILLSLEANKVIRVVVRVLLLIYEETLEYQV